METSIGQQLRKARETQALTIDQAAAATRIRAHYLSAIELGEWDKLPSVVQARGFVRAYADFLGLDADLLLNDQSGKEPPSEKPAASKPAIERSPAEPAAPAAGLAEPAPGAEAFKQSERIFAEIGQRLRSQRELLGLSLDDVERHTFLRQRYLRALEEGDLNELPSPVQGRGMLDNYASFLGMNSEALLLLFAEGLQAQLDARRGIDTAETKPEPVVETPSKPSRLRGLLAPDILIGGSLLIFLGTFIIWGAIRIFNQVTAQDAAVEATPTAPSIAEVLLATSTPSETPPPQPATPTSKSAAPLFPTFPAATGTVSEGAPPGGTSPVQVYLTISQRAWMRVTVDGQVEFEGRVIPGSAYPFVGQQQVEVLTGNAAALQVFYNGFDLGALGNVGQIVNQVFTAQGILTPTPTVTPTSAVAPTPAETPAAPPAGEPPTSTAAP
ncbi:MAG: DUF4115 domain-containing protein [Anaerolineales bacterium]|nr:DUF4115 domain-containing protein [Anaerolineales bacterium]